MIMYNPVLNATFMLCIFQGAQHLKDLVVKKKPSGEKSSDEKVNDDSSSIDYSHHSSVKNFQLAILT